MFDNRVNQFVENYVTASVYKIYNFSLYIGLVKVLIVLNLLITLSLNICFVERNTNFS